MPWVMASTRVWGRLFIVCDVAGELLKLVTVNDREVHGVRIELSHELLACAKTSLLDRPSSRHVLYIAEGADDVGILGIGVALSQLMQLGSVITTSALAIDLHSANDRDVG